MILNYTSNTLCYMISFYTILVASSWSRVTGGDTLRRACAASTRTRGWRAASAAGLWGQGSHERGGSFWQPPVKLAKSRCESSFCMEFFAETQDPSPSPFHSLARPLPPPGTNYAFPPPMLRSIRASGTLSSLLAALSDQCDIMPSLDEPSLERGAGRSSYMIFCKYLKLIILVKPYIILHRINIIIIFD